MKNKKKIVWSKPKCETMDKEQLQNSILALACSKFMECPSDAFYIDSIPGFDVLTI